MGEARTQGDRPGPGLTRPDPAPPPIVVRADDDGGAAGGGEGGDARGEGRLARLARLAWPVAALVLFTAALLALRRELHAYRYHDVVAAFAATPHSTFAWALLFTIAGYLLTLPGYDALALRYVRRPLPPRQTVFASFVAYAVSQTVGLSVLTGGSIRETLPFPLVKPVAGTPHHSG